MSCRTVSLHARAKENFFDFFLDTEESDGSISRIRAKIC